MGKGQRNKAARRAKEEAELTKITAQNKNITKSIFGRKMFWGLVILTMLAIPAVVVLSNTSLKSDVSTKNKLTTNSNTAQSLSSSPLVSLPPENKSAFAKPITDTTHTQFLSFSDFKKPRNVGELNLLCAKGLPGSEDLDIPKCLKTLKEWAKYIDKETKRYLNRYYSNPEKYYNSLPYFKVLIMMTVLHEDMGIRYNPDLIKPGRSLEEMKKNYTKNSRDVFIHGLLTGKRQGTCASMPVLVVALGELLNYPLKIVSCKGHLFVRWDDNKEIFNFDVTGGGVQLKSDKFYINWPYPLSKKELAQGFYMKSLTHKEAYCAFLINRAGTLRANRRIREADMTARTALNLVPYVPIWKTPIALELNRLTRRKSNNPRIEQQIRVMRAERQKHINLLSGKEREKQQRILEQSANTMREILEEYGN